MRMRKNLFTILNNHGARIFRDEVLSQLCARVKRCGTNGKLEAVHVGGPPFEGISVYVSPAKILIEIHRRLGKVLRDNFYISM